MKPTQSQRPCAPRKVRPRLPGTGRGMTLLEMTVVILVLLTLISTLFIGASAWKNGSDRTMCVMNLQNVQKGVRSFSNMNGYQPGMTVDGLRGHIIGLGCFVEADPICPHGGTYTFGGDVIPAVGALYANCSLADSDEHRPKDPTDW